MSEPQTDKPAEFGQDAEELEQGASRETSAHYLPPNEDAEKTGDLEKSLENS